MHFLAAYGVVHCAAPAKQPRHPATLRLLGIGMVLQCWDETTEQHFHTVLLKIAYITFISSRNMDDIKVHQEWRVATTPCMCTCVFVHLPACTWRRRYGFAIM
jgi:hypothetical protein